MIAKKITRALSIVVVLFLLIVFTAAGFYFGLTYVLSQNSRFAKLDKQFNDAGSAIGRETPGAVELIIPRAATTQKIADLLKDKKIIENTFVFTILSKFNGFDGNYMAGTHFVASTMSYDEIMYVLSQKPQSVRVTFPEGLTYNEVKARMRKAGVNFDETVLDSMVRNPQSFLDYEFVTDIEKKEGRDWLLQGYLYPDTYEFDMNTDEETIVRTFLNNTEKKLLSEYYDRLEKLDPKLTMDEVIALASIIQQECMKIEEMRTVSGVFYNRLRKTGWTLSACSTVNYLRKEAGLPTYLWLSLDHINQFDNNPYNTYKYIGLPPGPICSPGEDAIRAALWPEKHTYLFFSAKGDGWNVFAKTESEHFRNIEKYQKNPATGETTEEEPDE
jgi:UPF0755 protein